MLLAHRINSLTTTLPLSFACPLQVHCRTMLASNLVLHLPLTIIRATSAQVHERAPPAAIAGWCAMQVSLG